MQAVLVLNADLGPLHRVSLRHAIRMLSDRVYIWVVLLMSFTLFGYAAMKHEPWSFAVACAFTALVLVPLAWRERGR